MARGQPAQTTRYVRTRSGNWPQKRARCYNFGPEIDVVQTRLAGGRAESFLKGNTLRDWSDVAVKSVVFPIIGSRRPYCNFWDFSSVRLCCLAA